MGRKIRIGMPYFMIYFCLFYVAGNMYLYRHIVVGIFLALSLFWFWQFISTVRFFRLKDEFDEIIAEAKKRVDAGAPAGELIEMAKDRLRRMTSTWK